MRERIYLDNNASTALDPRVLSLLTESLLQLTGNPSSIHSFGMESRNAINKARRIIAQFLKVKPSEIIFTSNGTEGMNMLIEGILAKYSSGHVVTSSTEHACVYSSLKRIEARGFKTSFLNPGPWGAVTPAAVENALRGDTCLIVLMAVNNETGVKTDIETIAKIAKEKKVPFIVDGVALLGKESFTIPEGVSAMCFSGHKIHAPKGIGFVYLKSTLPFIPLIVGGDQESGRRGGTENVPGIAALGEAIKILEKELPEASVRMQKLRDKLEKGLFSKLQGLSINGEGPRSCNVSNISFENIEGETLIARLDREGIAVSHGSACSSGALEPSRILRNMDLPAGRADSAIRFSLSRFTTDAEIEDAIEIISKVVTELRT
jgi:cysteine desulfurase